MLNNHTFYIVRLCQLVLAVKVYGSKNKQTNKQHTYNILCDFCSLSLSPFFCFFFSQLMIQNSSQKASPGLSMFRLELKVKSRNKYDFKILSEFQCYVSQLGSMSSKGSKHLNFNGILSNLSIITLLACCQLGQLTAQPRVCYFLRINTTSL